MKFIPPLSKMKAGTKGKGSKTDQPATKGPATKKRKADDDGDDASAAPVRSALRC